MVTIDFKLADIKAEGLFAEVREKYVEGLDFEVLCIFGKNAVLNTCRYLKSFIPTRKY